MIVLTRVRRIRGLVLASVLAAWSAMFGLAGCQPEGVGSMKPPAGKRDDSKLGRPFGNAPDPSLSKKRGKAPLEDKGVDKINNPRLCKKTSGSTGWGVEIEARSVPSRRFQNRAVTSLPAETSVWPSSPSAMLSKVD